MSQSPLRPIESAALEYSRYRSGYPADRRSDRECASPPAHATAVLEETLEEHDELNIGRVHAGWTLPGVDVDVVASTLGWWLVHLVARAHLACDVVGALEVFPV